MLIILSQLIYVKVVFLNYFILKTCSIQPDNHKLYNKLKIKIFYTNLSYIPTVLLLVYTHIIQFKYIT